MGIREKLNENPAITTGATIGIIVLALLLIVWNLWPENPTADMPTKWYFTTDDGQTLFTDDLNKVAPFDREGKEAVRARVFSCDGGKTQFVGYLEKLSDKGLKRAAAAKNERGEPDVEALEAVRLQETLVKPKGSGKWVKMFSPQGSEILNAVKCDSPEIRPEELLGK